MVERNMACRMIKSVHLEGGVFSQNLENRADLGGLISDYGIRKAAVYKG